MNLLLVGIGQETSLAQLDQTENVLVFKREDGMEFRVHVDQQAVKEVILAASAPSTIEVSQEMKARIAVESMPDESDATEFGGDADESSEEPAFQEEPQEQYGSEEEVPSL